MIFNLNIFQRSSVPARRYFYFFIFLSGITMACQSGGSAQERAYPEFVEQVFLSEEAALKLVFPDSDRFVKRAHFLTSEEKKRIESRLGWSLPESTVTIHAGFYRDQPQGAAVVTEEVGKFKPITFIVKVSEKGKVDRVEVMVYRESVGSEVRRRRFTGQFKGKSVKDPLRINRDILNVTGATMSVQAMAAGVKKALVLLDEVYFKK